jgi:glutamine amidotransferase
MSQEIVAVVDYEMGNLYSVVQALRVAAMAAQGQSPHHHWQICIAQTPEAIAQADRIILPGQGAMPACMAHLKRLGLHEPLMAALRTKPVLGICVGMQMLLDRSEEGDVPTLAWIPGRVKRLRPEQNKEPIFAEKAFVNYKIPHMGWNQVHINHHEHPIWKNISQDSYFYFVHSFAAFPEQIIHQAAYTEYGVRFCSAVVKENVFATQFHPEKSGDTGLQLYRNFLAWQP